MRDLPLNALRAFAAVYETGGVRPAGRALQVTHSSVSRHLRELEAWIQTPLFDERPRRRSLAFTAEGEALGRTALASLRELEGAVASVREAKRTNSVTIATTPSVAVRWLLPRLPSFEAENKWIEVSVVVDQRRRAPIEEGADISIRMGRGPWRGVVGDPLMDDRLYPVMSTGYWQDAGQPDDIAELARLRLLHDRDPNASWAAWKQEHGPALLDVRRGPRFTSSDLVLRAAEQGLGVALARDRLASDSIANGTLVRPFGRLRVLLQDAYWLLEGTTQRKRQAVRSAIDWLVTEAGRG